LWKTSGQKGGAGGAEDRKSLFSRITYVQIKCGVGNADCGVNGNSKSKGNGNGKDLNRKGRQERKGRQRLFL
jgi:hypothetical protein